MADSFRSNADVLGAPGAVCELVDFLKSEIVRFSLGNRLDSCVLRTANRTVPSEWLETSSICSGIATPFASRASNDAPAGRSPALKGWPKVIGTLACAAVLVDPTLMQVMACGSQLGPVLYAGSTPKQFSRPVPHWVELPALTEGCVSVGPEATVGGEISAVVALPPVPPPPQALVSKTIEARAANTRR